MDLNLIDNRYKTIKSLGEGGMGAVFLVEDTMQANHIFALKTIKSSFVSNDKENSLQQFKIEYEIMTRLKHPNLVRVYEFGQSDNGDYFIVMEHVVGVTLREYLIPKPQLTIDEALAIVIPLLRAFEFIHSRNIIYRDLKPENVMIKLKDGQIDTIKLLDFGLSDLGGAKRGTIKGTIHYIAPEVINHQSIDSRSDIFSLGVLFYELLSSAYIYRDSSTSSIINSLASDKRFINSIDISFSTYTSQLFKPVIKKMIAFNKDERFACCLEVIDAINKICERNFEFETQETQQAYVLGSSFINRKQEMEILCNATKNITPAITLISGSVGIGKSRLISEFHKFCSLNNLSVFSGSSNNSLAYEPFLTIISKMLPSLDNDHFPEMAGYLKTLFPEHPALVDLAMPPNLDWQTLKSVLIQVIANLVIVFSQNKHDKTVLIFNNFHNIDEISSEIISTIISKLKESEQTGRILIIAECRADELSKISAFTTLHSEKNNLTMLELKPLSTTDVEEFITQMFGSSRIHHTITEHIGTIRDLVGGNPLFLQELLKLLVNTRTIERRKSHWVLQKSLSKIEIPATVKEIMRKRLTDLHFSAEYLYAFHLVAILYKSSLDIQFMNRLTHGIINVKWDDFFHYLLENEIIYQKEQDFFPVSKLIGEIIREDISANESMELNRIVANRLEEIYQVTAATTDKLSDDELDEITYHFINSQYEDKQNLAERTLPYLLASGKRSEQRFAYRKALVFYNQIINITEKIHEASVDHIILEAISRTGSIYYSTNNLKDAERILLECLLKYEHSATVKEIADIKNKLAMIYQFKSDDENTLKYNQEAKELYDSINDQSGKASYYFILGKQDTLHGRYLESLDNFQKALTGYLDTDNSRMTALCYINIGNTYWYLHDNEQAIQYYKKQIKVSENENLLDAFGMALGNIGMVYAQMSDHVQALIYLKKAIGIDEKIGANHGISVIYNNMSALYNNLGDFQKALTCCQKAQFIAHEAKYIYGLVSINFNYACAYRGINNFEKAESHFDLSIQLAQSIDAKYYICDYTIVKTLFLLDRKKYSEAIALIDTIDILISELKNERMTVRYQEAKAFTAFFITDHPIDSRVQTLLQTAQNILLKIKDDDLENRAEVHFRVWKIISQNCDHSKYSGVISKAYQDANGLYQKLASKSKLYLYKKRLDELVNLDDFLLDDVDLFN